MKEANSFPTVYINTNNEMGETIATIPGHERVKIVS